MKRIICSIFALTSLTTFASSESLSSAEAVFVVNDWAHFCYQDFETESRAVLVRLQLKADKQCGKYSRGIRVTSIHQTGSSGCSVKLEAGYNCESSIF